MNRKLSAVRLIGLLGVCCVGFLAASAAHATESRAQSLLYNLAFEDDTDVFLFPQLTPRHAGVYFHTPGSAANVYGGAILDLGDGALGVYVRRPGVTAFDQYRLAVTEADLFPSTGLLRGFAGSAATGQPPGQALDVIWGNGTVGAGLRLHVWSEDGQQRGVLTDAPVSDQTLTTEINGGIRLEDGFDLHGSLLLRSVDDAGNGVRAALGLRRIAPWIGSMTSVLAAELQAGFGIPESGGKSLGVALPVKAGVQYRPLGEQLVVAMLAGMDVQALDAAGQDAELGVAIPTLELATEWYARDWLHLRTAMRAGYGWQATGQGDHSQVPFEQVAFSAGMGVKWGALRADAVFRYSLLQNGPYFVGGSAGLFSGVTFCYLWGDASQASAAVAAPARSAAALRATPAAPAPAGASE